eukprot:c12492_g1_i1.p1 GENE.c12492_g1_i1~~c12492_g1_i1.p1  ORF type:complete len:267 (-),score=99.30 c12492_g1_i1:27-827(-)
MFARSLCITLLLSLSFVVAQDQGNTTVLGDLTISGVLRTTKIHSGSLTIDGSMSVTQALSGESIQVNHASLNVLQAVAISSPTGTLHVAGELSLGGALSTNGSVSASSFIQADVRQWALKYHDDFEGQTLGWSTNLTSSCDGNDHHLAGHCNQVQNEVKKVFSNLGEHKFIRLQARYHFLDSWEGETAFAKIGDRIVWSDVNDVRGIHPNTLNACGGEHPDTKISVPIDVTIPHTAETISISFGSTLDEHPCNESFGIDDVMISVR